ncbi:hypothetical protein F5Y12DRAFT_799290 [Xylaria sp. FL1777]|nr:hypothetical protein F5Y12DRAFT_799290 [Xylaria sp. FL1777]
MKPAVVSVLSLGSVGIANPLSELGVKVVSRAPPQQNGIAFDCNDFPEVCSNMCYGAYCVPSKAEFLVYDQASSQTKSHRRRAAGCLDNQKPGNNRCSQGRPGAQPNYNCDEYPFASSKAGPGSNTNGKENRCSRCVPKKQNSRQGAALSKGYRDFCHNNAPCQFEVYFENPGSGKHCDPLTANNCAADAAEQCSGSINIIIQRAEYAVVAPADVVSKRDVYANGTYVPGPAQFRTYGGKLLDAPYGGTIGQPVHAPRPVDEELHEKLIDEHDYDEEEAGEAQFDEIVANMVSHVDYLKEVVWEARLKE